MSDDSKEVAEPPELVLSQPLGEAMLGRLGFSGLPAADLEGLAGVYKSWLQNVPFCSSLKRCHYGDDVNRPGPLPIATAPDFVAAYLEHGTGGTCFPTAEAFFQMLRVCGFTVRRALGSMLDFPQIPGPNHGTVIVTLEGRDYLVDPFFGSEQPLPLDVVPHSVGRPALELRSEDGADGEPPTIFWRFHNSRQWMRFGFDPRYVTVTNASFVERYEASAGANSVFNATLYISKHKGEDVHTIFRDEYFILRPDNAIDRAPVGDRRNQLLVEIFGLSPEMAEKIPYDCAG